MQRLKFRLILKFVICNSFHLKSQLTSTPTPTLTLMDRLMDRHRTLIETFTLLTLKSCWEALTKRYSTGIWNAPYYL